MALKRDWETSIRLTIVLNLLVYKFGASVASETKNSVNKTDLDEFDEELRKIGPTLIDIAEGSRNESIRPSSRLYNNGTFTTGNELWDNILNQCSAKPNFSCLQKNVFNYLDSSLSLNEDVNVTNGICLKKNRVDYNRYSREANLIYVAGSPKETVEEENEIEEDRASKGDSKVEEQWESETPLEEVTDGLYDKSVHFMMTHDLSLKLPDAVFDGATLRLSPRALTKTGALVHIDIQPKASDVGDGRIFFKKIKKYLKKKMVMAALSIALLVILIKLKVFFVLPLLLGVGAAKKMIIKMLLFMFPSMGNVFKLCGWYHSNYHLPKYHHHHHLVSHHHHKQPVFIPQPPHLPHHSPHHAAPVHHPSPVYGPPHHSPPPPIVSYGPPGPPASAHVYHSEPPSEHFQQDWELSGPGLGSEYISGNIHRNAADGHSKPQVEDLSEINAWGLGLTPGSVSAPPGSVYPHEIPGLAAAGNTYSEVRVRPGHLKDTIRPVGPPGAMMVKYRKPQLQGKEVNIHQAEKEALQRAVELAQQAPPSPVRDELLRVSQLQLREQNRVRIEQKLIEQQQKILAEQDPELQKAEKFYGALVNRVENILQTIGASDAGCRERAVCSLYKDPAKHSPFSNLVSNELSKDNNELPPAAGSKFAIRFYKYVQSARDGQEQKDCLAHYPVCTVIDFHKKK